MLEDFFSDIISKARFGLGQSIEQVAGAVDVSSQRLQALERGVKPTNAECASLAQALGLYPEALWLVACENYRPVPPLGAGAGVRTLQVTRMRANAYLVKVSSDDSALLVDPGGEPDKLLAMARTADLTINGILLTHGHTDHTGAAMEIAKATRAPVLAHPYELRGPTVTELNGDGRYTVGNVDVHVFACPGHTPGSCAYLVNGRLFTGDCLFAGSLGRAATPKDYPELLASGYRLLQLPTETPVFPGHGPVTSVELERQHNPFLAGWFAQASK